MLQSVQIFPVGNIFEQYERFFIEILIDGTGASTP